jgi:hypothetical protein
MQFSKNIICIAFLTLYVFLCCKTEEQTQPNNIHPVSADSDILIIADKNINFDSLLQKIDELQNNVLHQPDNRLAIENLLKTSSNHKNSTFYCVGRGIINPKFPVAVRQQIMSRASLAAAQNWALYLVEWRRGNYISRTKGVAGSLSTSGNSVSQKIIGDTLLLLVSFPSGQ